MQLHKSLNLHKHNLIQKKAYILLQNILDIFYNSTTQTHSQQAYLAKTIEELIYTKNLYIFAHYNNPFDFSVTYQ